MKCCSFDFLMITNYINYNLPIGVIYPPLLQVSTTTVKNYVHEIYFG